MCVMMLLTCFHMVTVIYRVLSTTHFPGPIPYAAMILVEPVMIPYDVYLKYKAHIDGATHFLSKMLAKRREVWPSKQDASAWLSGRLPWKQWDQRMVTLFVVSTTVNAKLINKLNNRTRTMLCVWKKMGACVSRATENKRHRLCSTINRTSTRRRYTIRLRVSSLFILSLARSKARRSYASQLPCSRC
jgi:hypothetical protein